MRSLITAIALTLGVAAAAAAQQATPAPSGGPLVLERVPTPFVVAPEYKATEVDGDFGQLVGGYAGQMVNGQLLVGGAGYWLANGSHDTRLAYGGLLVGWSMSPESRVRFGARGLIGGGSAELPTSFTVLTRQPDPRLLRFGGGPSPSVPQPTTIRVRQRDDFMVLEPQADVVTHVTDHVGVDLSIGYRWTAFDRVLRDRIDGVTGSLGLQLGW
jgi:hypothetical protein